MKLEDVRDLLVNDKNKTLRPSNNNIVKEQDISDFGFLFVDVYKFFESKNIVSILKVKAKIKKHKVVKQAKFNYDKETKLKSLYLETEYGSGTILTSDLFFDTKSDSFFVKGHCHSNSMIAVAKIGEDNPCMEPKVLTGIADFKMFKVKPFLHSVYQIKTKKYGEIIIDHNIDLAMSPNLYNLFLHLEVLGEFYPYQWKPMCDKVDKCNKVLEQRCKEDHKGLNIYAILAYDDYMRYLDDVIENEKEDNFPFKVEKQAIKKEI